MRITKTMTRRLVAGCFAAAVIAAPAAATAGTATATNRPSSDSACSFDSAYLPRTADAIVGWYAQCRTQQGDGVAQGGYAIEAWSE